LGLGHGIEAVKRLFKVILPVLAIAAAVGAAGWLKSTKPVTPASPPRERVWVVEAARVAFADVRPELSLFGEVVAAREVALRALVAGPVQAVSERFVDGGTVAAGEVLVTIDPFDFEQDVAERRAELDEARARLAEMTAGLGGERAMLEEDRRQLELTRRDVERRESLLGSAVSEKGLDEARLSLSRAEAQRLLREQAIATMEARIDQQHAVIARTQAALARARRGLADATLKAPFDGYLADIAAQPGEQLGRGERVARLIDSSRLEVRCHLSDAQFGRAFAGLDAEERVARVRWRIGDEVREFDAVIDRIDSEIDPTTGGMTAFARIVDHGKAAFASLRPGAFVEVVVPDRLYRQVARLPATALHGDDTVYAVVEGRLEPRAVELLRRYGETVLVVGEIAEGEEVATTRFTEIGPGVRVTVR
jgi:RND family efflux transporter MFP subunit